ncbi:hypothetical protein UY3_06104 [Chelonia mydas]|uniref:Uncharacterized protein n=1 Tax=Chelonia mydas TaxID=8469 RepID=M7BHN2_CHEMY|nr:hypothetical protein UY3_06104 [Chelonia mydas]
MGAAGSGAGRNLLLQANGSCWKRRGPRGCGSSVWNALVKENMAEDCARRLQLLDCFRSHTECCHIFRLNKKGDLTSRRCSLPPRLGERVCYSESAQPIFVKREPDFGPMKPAAMGPPECSGPRNITEKLSFHSDKQRMFVGLFVVKIALER